MIAPSLLSCDFSKLGEEIKEVENAGADILHLDIMDGHFVPNITFGPIIVRAIRKLTKLPIDAHLMISEPEKYIDNFIEAGSDWISFHIETTRDPVKLAKHIRQKGKKAGIAINPDTPFENISHTILNLDFLLIMTVFPGFGGQRFIQDCVPKIKEAAKFLNGRIPIEVDGGINSKTKDIVIEAGAEILVAGSYVFNSTKRREAIMSLRR